MQRVRRLVLRSLVVGLTGCASVPGPSTGGITWSPALELGGRTYAAEWVLPAGEPQALLVLQHGFSRSCANLRETMRRIARQGLATLCVNADMAYGNPALADTMAAALLSGLVLPDGRPLPQRIVVGGHSAGAAFAARLGWRLDASAPARLAGALLLDPVPVPGFADQLRAVSHAGQRPVLSIAAAPDGCNAEQRATPVLRELHDEAARAGHDSVIAFDMGPGSTHVDAEGEDSDWLGRTVCGTPSAAKVEQLRAVAAGWAADLAAGRVPSAGTLLGTARDL
ncbi:MULTISPECIES: alpha/beta hydrolase family protein [Rubrivivax]|uniref:Alpha/beta hydrolase n=1 Tax=Rubrivivax benzoatilyticus TaxID=316997 RepID=A0ABX0HWQ1_9BURK|nr:MULTISPECIES: alpha/beta hydrolase [Rubrivivax]NHK98746.1 alpha/beta hydrolase [Rubrivivax benzoatilyticus]NHL24248.1 alpha/beta hydrolase [Rubrivivax benzoatilyticus]